MELTSPGDFVKQKLLSVQEYVALSVRALGNLFTRPRYPADMIQQADLIGFGRVDLRAAVRRAVQRVDDGDPDRRILLSHDVPIAG